MVRGSLGIMMKARTVSMREKKGNLGHSHKYYISIYMRSGLGTKVAGLGFYSRNELQHI